MTEQILNPSNCRADVLWNVAFSDINTASGVIENGSAAGIAESLLSEARFFRAFDYFELVQTFGGVPLNLGAGELKFNINATRTSNRNTVPEVYTKAVFPDLKTAIEQLPDAGRVTGGVTKTAARLVLAKAYLTYGWWLQNPNNIPTYPTCDRQDPDGHDAAWYFQQAYNIAVEAINNPAGFGLQKSFYMVNVGTNDRNNEILLYADHNESNNYYDGGTNFDWAMVMRLATLHVGCAVGTIPSWRHPRMQRHGMHSVLYSVKPFRVRTVLGSRWLLLSRS